ncbi:hypothetical protein HDU98_003624, partial [Podochytrium sp. JEL0797]
YPTVLESCPFLPKSAGLHWLRFFAAKQNMLFTLAVASILYVVFSILLWILSSPDAGNVATAAASAAGVGARIPHGQHSMARQQQENQYRARQQLQRNMGNQQAY